MAIYIGLIAFVLVLPAIVSPFCRTPEKKNQAVAAIGMLAIFLLLALKGDVGSDISGYLRDYNISATKAWNDFDYIYFEEGYILLTKAFAKAGIPFQAFMVCVYAFACSTMYVFIKKYSKNPVFSLIIFICYQFLVFYISGVRQTIAMSFSLMTFMVFQKRKPVWYVLAIVLQVIAYYIHQSSIVFVLVLLLSLIKKKKIRLPIYVIAAGMAIVCRNLVWRFVDSVFRELEVGTKITLGLSFLFIIAVSFLMYATNTEKSIFRLRMADKPIDEETDYITVFASRILLVAVAAMLLFSGHSMMRAVMYLTLFMIVGLPNTTYKLEPLTRFIVEYVLIIFFITLFYLDTLVPNQLELCPYVFFWE